MDMCFEGDDDVPSIASCDAGQVDEDTAAQEVLDTILAGERLKAEEQFGALGNTAGATTTGPAR